MRNLVSATCYAVAVRVHTSPTDGPSLIACHSRAHRGTTACHATPPQTVHANCTASVGTRPISARPSSTFSKQTACEARPATHTNHLRERPAGLTGCPIFVARRRDEAVGQADQREHSQHSHPRGRSRPPSRHPTPVSPFEHDHRDLSPHLSKAKPGIKQAIAAVQHCCGRDGRRPPPRTRLGLDHSNKLNNSQQVVQPSPPHLRQTRDSFKWQHSITQFAQFKSNVEPGLRGAGGPSWLPTITITNSFNKLTRLIKSEQWGVTNY